MRKVWILAIVALVLVTAGAPSFSAETTLTGTYRIRSVADYNWEKRDLAIHPEGRDLYTGYFDQRFRLTITHRQSEFLKAVVSIDIVEDVWGRGGAFRMNNSAGTDDGFINSAYIEAITPVGLLQLGTNAENRFGYGLWSDSSIRGDANNNPSITYGMKVGGFIATASYVKYIDWVRSVFTIPVYPGAGPSDFTGGPASAYYNYDIDTYILTAHYVTDTWKVGGLFQWIPDPRALGAVAMSRGVADIGAFPGSFRGEEQWMDPVAVPSTGLNGGIYWPTPAGPNAIGFGRAGMYGANLFAWDVYGNVKLLNDRLEIKGEFLRLWGVSKRNSLGDAYNDYLATRVILPPLPIYRLPEKIIVEGTTVYLDVSYDFGVWKVGVAALYGSGEKHWHAFTQSHTNFNTIGNDDFHWGALVVPGNWMYLGSTGSNRFYNAPLGLGDNPENVTSVKLYWSAAPNEKLDIHGAFIWAKYTQPVGRYARDGAGNLVPGWNAFYGHPMNYIQPSALLPGNTYIPAGVDDELGWEIDLGATYEIMEGLTLNSEFGVLFTGSAFDYRNPVTNEREHWGPIYRWVNTLTYEF